MLTVTNRKPEELSSELETLLQSTKDWGPGVYVRLRNACTEWQKYTGNGCFEPDPITTVARLRAEFKEDKARFFRLPNFGRKSFEYLERLLNGDENRHVTRVIEPKPIMLDADSECPWCHARHDGRCPHIKSLEYFETGAVRRVEFFEGVSC